MMRILTFSCDHQGKEDRFRREEFPSTILFRIEPGIPYRISEGILFGSFPVIFSACSRHFSFLFSIFDFARGLSPREESSGKNPGFNLPRVLSMRLQTLSTSPHRQLASLSFPGRFGTRLHLPLEEP